MCSFIDTSLSPTRRWWLLALIVLLIAAAVLRGVGYNFSLPYVEHPDEPVFYLTGQEWRGTFNLDNYLNGYPPLYIWLNIGVQWLAEPFGIRTVAPTVGLLRLLSIGFNLLTLVLIGDTARRAGGTLAGIAAGAAWAFAPLVIANGGYATPDPLVYGLVIASVWFAVIALSDPKRAHWCIWSVAAGCLAILAKYYVVSAVLPGMAAAVWIFARDRRQGLRYLAVQIALGVVTAAVSLGGMAVLAREGARARGEGLTNILNLSRLLNNLYYAILPVNPSFFLLMLGAGVVAFFLVRRSARVRLETVALCALILISVPWLAATFSLVSATERLKDVLPATTAACVLLGIGLAQFARLLPRYARPLVVMIPALLVYAPQLADDFTLMRDRTLPESRVALRQWADANLTPGTVLVGEENHKTFNPYWGGIEGQHWFDWIEISGITQKTTDAWMSENGASYAVIGMDEAASLEASGYLADALHLRSFGLAGARGPQMAIYRLWRMQHSTDVLFGGQIRLLGYDLSDETITSGSLTLTFYWNAPTAPSDNYSLFIHLVPHGSDDLIAQADGAPARPERPTLTWTDAGETLISQPFTLTIPADVPAGEYDLRIGLYNYQTGARLTLDDGTDSYTLTTLSLQ